MSNKYSLQVSNNSNDLTELQTTSNMKTKQTKGLNRNTIDKYYTKDDR